MVVNLVKGGNVNLTKEAGAAGLSRVAVGLGWDERTTSGAAFDLDASALLVGDSGKVLSDAHFIFYGALKFPADVADEAAMVLHTGDVLDGSAEGDDETINLNLSALPAEVTRVVFAVSIYDAETRSQNFGQVANAYIHVVNGGNGVELTRFDLTEDASTETAMIFGELYRNAAEWKFRAVGQGYASGLGGIARDFGVNVG